MFDADPRPLPFPLGEPASVESPSYGGDFLCQVPDFPEDSDEKITVLFRLSLNDFVKIATAVDVGSDIAYGEDGITLWELWSLAYMCASFCEEMAVCLTDENSAVVEALSNLIQNNLTIQNAISSAIQQQGGAVPGQPLTPTQAATDTLPANVKDEEGDCIFDALWGACLYLVQSGNRAITDFFEQIEAVSNQIETAAIVSQTIPAAGAYVSAAAEFADQLQENIAEGYAGAYTETYENELACALFCIARSNCELTPDMLMTVMAERLGYVEGTENFGTVMARIGEGIFIGSQIADSAFYIYFTALRFGQQFGSILGFRPLTDLMSLGADFLASDNWETLCDCPEVSEHRFDFETGSLSWTPFETYAEYVTDTGWYEDTPGIIWIKVTIPDSGRVVTAVDFEVATGNQVLAQVGTPGDCSVGFVGENAGSGYNFYTVSLIGETGFDTPITEIAVRVAVDGFVPVTGAITAITLHFDGTDPF
jgi:hypothetical protein